MQLPAAIRTALEQQLHTSVIDFIPASGGCINHGGAIKTQSGDAYFIKWNDARKFPGMFVAERHGLERLASTNTVRVPQPVHTFEHGPWQEIVMEYLSKAFPSPRYWELLGEQLADLHRHTSSSFGLDSDNYIGSLQQINTWQNSWPEFFILNRLEVQLRLARQRGKADGHLCKRFEKLYKLFGEIFPTEQPALLHGDLWSGNLINDIKGDPCLIDPAVYYGHREAEVAFTQLFGGFDNRFYEAYHACFPIQPGFDERSDIYNLYPLLVHVNLFGGSYLTAVKQILDRFGC